MGEYGTTGSGGWAHGQQPPAGPPPQVPPPAGPPPAPAWGNNPQYQNPQYQNPQQPMPQQPTTPYPPAQQPTPPYPGAQQPAQYPTTQQPAGPYPGAPYQGYPGGPHPGAGGPGDWASGASGLSGLQAPRGRRRGRLIVAVAASVVAVLGIAGGAYAVLGNRSGNTPDQYVPADAIGVVSVDLDPGTTQTVNALRFFHAFPSLGTKQNGNLIDGVLRAALQRSDAKDDFEKDIRPWLGSQIAIAADPQGDHVYPVLVAEVTDQEKARTGLTHLAADADDTGWVFQDNYVIISDSTKIAGITSTDAQKSSIADDSGYQKDVAALGDGEWVIQGWADATRIPQDGENPLASVPGLEDTPLPAVKGRAAFEVRFGANHAELYVKAFGNQSIPTGTVGPDMATLPGDTALAVGISGLDTLGPKITDALTQSGLTAPLDALAEQTGLKLPDDLLTVLGDKAVLAADNEGSNFGLISSGDPATAKQTADKMLTALGLPEMATRQSGDRTVFATSSDYADQLATKGDLGKQDMFRTAVPDAANAMDVLFVNMTPVLAIAGDDLPADAKHVKAVGLTVGANGDTATLRLRVVVGQ